MEKYNTVKTWGEDLLLKKENRIFCLKIIFYSILYFAIYLFLNSIRSSWPSWIVGIFAISDLIIYLSIIYSSFSRSLVFGLNKYVTAIIFIIFGILGKMENNDLVIVPFVVIVMIIFSSRNKKLSDKEKVFLEDTFKKP